MLQTLVRALPLTLLIGATTVTSGCRTFSDPGGVKNVFTAGTERVDRISWDATRRGTYIVTGSSGTKVVSEPPPDAALEAVANLSTKFGTSSGGDVEAKVDVTETVQALTRAVEISFLREAMYRLNEAHANGALVAADKDYEDEFRAIMTAAATLIAASNGTDDTQVILAAIDAIATLSERRDDRAGEFREGVARVAQLMTATAQLERYGLEGVDTLGLEAVGAESFSESFEDPHEGARRLEMLLAVEQAGVDVLEADIARIDEQIAVLSSVLKKKN